MSSAENFTQSAERLKTVCNLDPEDFYFRLVARNYDPKT